MKRLICALLLVGLLAASASALAASRLNEVIMIYEDYDGNHVEQTEVEDATLKEIEQILLRARDNRATLENNTMNCTLVCKMKEETSDLFDFAVATDSSRFITDMRNNQTYRLSEADWTRLWEIFDLVRDVMGYDASEVWNW